MKWFPWKWIVRRAARSSGLIDPFAVLARLRQFAEPSEVEAPLDLIRAWTVLQARGIVNSRAIQHNLDWIWPYWVERQFNPRDPSFVPRAFTLSHINLTHRNWTAVCVPDVDRYALVDPRGLVTPLHDGWSIDAWIIGKGRNLVPSRAESADQILHCRDELAIQTEIGEDGRHLSMRAEMLREEGGRPYVQLHWRAQADPEDMLCIGLRPYNPEGVQFIDSLSRLDDQPGWMVNGHTPVQLGDPPARYAASTYEEGDVYNHLRESDAGGTTVCPVGMLTAAALYPLGPEGRKQATARVSLAGEDSAGRGVKHRRPAGATWRALDDASPVLEVPDERVQYLYRAACRTLLALSSGEIYPGSYTYRRFWFRDACLMLNALLAMNHTECCRRAFDGSFPDRQTMRGFFQSQQGEWDSNGQVLWLAGRYLRTTGAPLPPPFIKAMRKGAEWILRKRRPDRPGEPYPGLLPPGLSAEHLGPNNFYYWDNFWGVAGLEEAAYVLHQAGHASPAEELTEAAGNYRRAIDESICRIPPDRCGGAIPAAPGRRMDGGAIGSLVADYPLQLYPAGDDRILRTAEFLVNHCMIEDGFFHDMNHSGINAYLTLHLAQVLLRAGDARGYRLFRRVAELASPTGQWPEAIHPFTHGGCMGDGQHGWAAAEWVLMVRSLFVREEADHLVVGAGVPREWMTPGARLRFGPTATRFGPVTVTVEPGPAETLVSVEGDWRNQPPRILNELASPSGSSPTLRIGSAGAGRAESRR